MFSLDIHPIEAVSAAMFLGPMAFAVPALLNRRRASRKRPRIQQPFAAPSAGFLTKIWPVDVPSAEALPAGSTSNERPSVEAASATVATIATAATRLSEPQTQADPLTGLPTQREFAARLQTAIRQAHDNGYASSLLLINLQGRQKIIAQHGTKTGDRALCEIARRLQGMLKKSEMLARLGDDDFAVIAEGQVEPDAHRDAASRMAARMVHKINQPVPANDCELNFDASIGIALCRSGIAGVSDLLQSAAGAMQQAKRRTSGFGLARQWQALTTTAEDTPEHQDLDAQRALSAAEILPFYQPVIDLATNRIAGFEALARWRHPTRGFVSPEEFVAVLERMGKMDKLTEVMLTQVCRDAEAWPANVHVAINVSPSELSDPLLAQRILRIIEQHGMAPKRLEIEITETALVHDIPAAKASLQAFRQAGIITALDDFGTGYSSLAQLRQLKFDRLKIDQSFVRGMLENGECDKIVDAILGLARSLNLQVVAEGIETEAAAANLSARGCEFGQGFYYSKALTAKAAGALLKTGLRCPIAA